MSTTRAATELLETLVGFATVSSESNLDLIHFVAEYLGRYAVESSLSFDETGSKANLFATVGPRIDGGIVLCGHSDVVPVEGQIWSSDPFRLREDAGRLYGRGSADMKGFIACALAMVPELVDAPLVTPVHIALTFDEEPGCCGAPVLVAQMDGFDFRPEIAIVGEPTEMGLVSGHKGGFEFVTTVTGFEGHASDPRRGVNAIAYAARFVQFLERTAADLASRPREDSLFDPAYTTISVGTIHGGTARNVIPGTCTLDWELRPVPGDDPKATIAAIESFARDTLAPEMRAAVPTAGIETRLYASYPGLAHEPESAAMTLVRELTGLNSSSVVPFGTDAGHLQHGGLSCVVFGPGSIEQAHKPDEFIEVDQLGECLDFLTRLRRWLCEPTPPHA